MEEKTRIGDQQKDFLNLRHGIARALAPSSKNSPPHLAMLPQYYLLDEFLNIPEATTDKNSWYGA